MKKIEYSFALQLSGVNW